MEWLWAAIWARIGWELGSVLFAVGIITVLFCGFFAYVLVDDALSRRARRQRDEPPF